MGSFVNASDTVVIKSLDESEMSTLYEFCFGKDKVTPLHPENDSDEILANLCSYSRMFSL